MSSYAIASCNRRQFSLRTLFFVTTVVCLCAASFQASPLFAMAFVPIVAAALVGTLRAVAAANLESATAARRGLFATFCQSLAIVLSFLVVALGTLTAAAAVGSLYLLSAMVRAAAPLVPAVRKIARAVRRFVVAIWQRVQPAIAQFNLSAALRGARAKAVTATNTLAATGLRLWRRYWSPAGSSWTGS